MEPPSNKKQKITALSSLVNQLKRWFRGDDDNAVVAAVETLTIPEATEAVAATIHNPRVSYAESLYGWWNWDVKTMESKKRGTEKCRKALERDAMEFVQQANTDETQLVKLSPNVNHSTDLPHTRLVQALQQLQPRENMGSAQEQQKRAKELAKILAPCLEHDYPENKGFDYLFYDENQFICTNKKFLGSLQELILELWDRAENGVPAVTLSLRVKPNTPLHKVCMALDVKYKMSTTICPPDTWCFGPPVQQASVKSPPGDMKAAVKKQYEKVKALRLPYEQDKRYYLIIGTPGALTKSHWDRGVQAVLYHTIAGTNHALAVPRQVALMLSAIDDGYNPGKHVEFCHKLERKALQKATVKAGTFTEGETMLILPGGGHAVLTGDEGKVVIAGEWHLDAAA